MHQFSHSFISDHNDFNKIASEFNLIFLLYYRNDKFLQCLFEFSKHGLLS